MPNNANDLPMPPIKAHTDYLRLLEQRASAQLNLAENLEEAQASVARVLELAAPRIAWFESKYGEWLATGADAVWGYSDAPPQLSSSGPLRPNTQTHGEYVRYLSMHRNALRVLGDLPEPATKASAGKILRIVPFRIERFDNGYAEWLANGTEAVWVFSDGPLPGLPEMP